MKIWEKLIVRPGTRVRLGEHDPDETLDHEKGEATDTALRESMARLDELQYLLYAEHRHALLVVLQGVDASGKDGTIRHVMAGLNPQGSRVTAFKAPSAAERDHDFLWRVHQVVPGLGDIAIFNRSHYEDVLVARVRALVPKEVWSARYDEINQFEDLLGRQGVRVVKFFLHISKDEQERRFEERLHDPTKQWKISAADFEDRAFWDQYSEAYQEALGRTSTHAAPWFIIPANRKWFRNLAVSRILVEALERLDMKFPKPTFDASRVKLV